MSSYYRQQLEDWLKHVDAKADRVLDVGGAQLPVCGRLKSFSAERYDILDLPEPHKKDATVREYLRFDLNVPLPSDIEVEPYDLVFCLEVMEYLWNPVVALANLAALTAPGGTLYVTFPFVYPAHEPVAEDRLRYTLAGAHKLLEVTGFEVEETIARYTAGSRATQRPLTSFYSGEGMRMASGPDHEEVGYIIKATRK